MQSRSAKHRLGGWLAGSFGFKGRVSTEYGAAALGRSELHIAERNAGGRRAGSGAGPRVQRFSGGPGHGGDGAAHGANAAGKARRQPRRSWAHLRIFCCANVATQTYTPTGTHST